MPFKEISVEDLYATYNKLKREDVKNLRQWMEKQPHLPKATDLQIALFLHSSNYSNEGAKNVLDTYFTIKTLCPDIFGSRTLQNELLKEATFTNLCSVLPKLSLSGDTVLYSRLMDHNPANFNFPVMFKLLDIVTLLSLHEKGPTNGIQFIFDMDLSTLSHLLKVSPTLVKRIAYYLQEGMPIRLHNIHFINIASFIDKALALVKPFLKKEILDLFIIHTEIQTLYKYIPKENLPKDIGGNAESFAELQELTREKILCSEDLLKFQENQLVDESKRQGPSKYAENLFGAEGNFKKLEID